MPPLLEHMVRRELYTAPPPILSGGKRQTDWPPPLITMRVAGVAITSPVIPTIDDGQHFFASPPAPRPPTSHRRPPPPPPGFFVWTGSACRVASRPVSKACVPMPETIGCQERFTKRSPSRAIAETIWRGQKTPFTMVPDSEATSSRNRTALSLHQDETGGRRPLSLCL